MSGSDANASQCSNRPPVPDSSKSAAQDRSRSPASAPIPWARRSYPHPPQPGPQARAIRSMATRLAASSTTDVPATARRFAGDQRSSRPSDLFNSNRPGAVQRLLLRRRQRFAGSERLGIQHQYAGLNSQHALPRRLTQLPEQLRRMPQPGRFDEQPIRPRLAQQTPEPDLKRRTIDATQTAPGHFTQCDTIGVPGQQRSIEADLAELVDQHRPTLVRPAVAPAGA